jgi:hypothetical protein
MPAWLIAIVGIQYAVVAVLLFKGSQPWLALAFVGYMLGNVGLAMVALGYR